MLFKAIHLFSGTLFPIYNEVTLIYWRYTMFYLLLRILHDEMTEGKISKDEYLSAVVKVALFHGIRRDGIR